MVWSERPGGCLVGGGGRFVPTKHTGFPEGRCGFALECALRGACEKRMNRILIQKENKYCYINISFFFLFFCMKIYFMEKFNCNVEDALLFSIKEIKIYISWCV